MTTSQKTYLRLTYRGREISLQDNDENWSIEGMSNHFRSLKAAKSYLDFLPMPSRTVMVKYNDQYVTGEVSSIEEDALGGWRGGEENVRVILGPGSVDPGRSMIYCASGVYHFDELVMKLLNSELAVLAAQKSKVAGLKARLIPFDGTKESVRL